jgi:hypothetical protein
MLCGDMNWAELASGGVQCAAYAVCKLRLNISVYERMAQGSVQNWRTILSIH